MFLADVCFQSGAGCGHIITDFTFVDVFQCNDFTLKRFDQLLHFINFSLESCHLRDHVRCLLRFSIEVLVAAEISKLAKASEREELAELRVPLSASF